MTAAPNMIANGDRKKTRFARPRRARRRGGNGSISSPYSGKEPLAAASANWLSRLDTQKVTISTLNAVSPMANSRVTRGEGHFAFLVNWKKSGLM